MSARPTAEIVAHLREWDDGDNEEFPGEVDIHREAADRLTELDARIGEVNAALDQYKVATYETASTAAFECVAAIRKAVGR